MDLLLSLILSLLFCYLLPAITEINGICSQIIDYKKYFPMSQHVQNAEKQS